MNKLRSTYTTCRVMSISLVLLLVFGSVVVPALPLKSLDSSVEQSHLLLNYTQAGINLEKCSWTQKMCVVYYDRPLTALNDTFHRKCRITDYGSGPEVDVCSPFHKTTAFYRYECLNRGKIKSLFFIVHILLGETVTVIHHFHLIHSSCHYFHVGPSTYTRFFFMYFVGPPTYHNQVPNSFCRICAYERELRYTMGG